MQNIGNCKFLSSADYNKIIELWQVSGLSHRPLGRDSRTNIDRQMQEENTRFLGIYNENQLIAAAIVSHNGRKGWINRLAVHPEFRLQNIATTMIDCCEEWLIREGIEIFAVLIEDDNKVSMDLFIKNDYIRHDDIIYFTKRKNDLV